jgi:hypothetical protein
MDRMLLPLCLLLLMPIAQCEESALLPGIEDVLAAEAQPAEQLEVLEDVLIVGGYATPKMWKVSRGDHAMWVLAQQRLPAGARWRLDEVEQRVAESQLVLYPGISTIDVDVGFFRIATLIPTAYSTMKNPGKQTLKDVLPADVYARWRVIKTRYVGRDNDIEEWRPFLAIDFLGDKVAEKIGRLPPATPPPAAPGAVKPVFGPLIEKTAKKHKVKIRTLRKVEREVKIRNVKDMLKSLRVPTGIELKCFTQALENLERRVEFADQQARGPVQGELKLPHPNVCGDIGELLLNGMRSGEIPDLAGIVKVVDNMMLQEKLAREQRDAEWLAAAEEAIAKNRSTFTMLGMNQITAPTGYIAKLRERGYTIEEPDRCAGQWQSLCS